MSGLTKNEEILLLAIYRLKTNAYGVRIKQQIQELTGEDWNIGLLYCTLDQVVKKGLLIKREGKPQSERGGRRKIFYRISSSGMRSLKDAYRLKKALWKGITIFEPEDA